MASFVAESRVVGIGVKTAAVLMVLMLEGECAKRGREVEMEATRGLRRWAGVTFGLLARVVVALGVMHFAGVCFCSSLAAL